MGCFAPLVIYMLTAFWFYFVPTWVNNQLRKVTKNKRVFPSDESVFKTLYLTIEYITRKWILPIRDWNEAMAHFLIKFDDRIQINN